MDAQAAGCGNGFVFQQRKLVAPTPVHHGFRAVGGQIFQRADPHSEGSAGTAGELHDSPAGGGNQAVIMDSHVFHGPKTSQG